MSKTKNDPTRPIAAIASACFNDTLKNLIDTEIALLTECEGCSEAEIVALEHASHLHLPATYCAYLRHLGHKSGQLFACDHMDAFYDDVMTIVTAQPKPWAEADMPIPADFVLPNDALVIASRQMLQFAFIRCNLPQDSPVWYFNVWDWKIVNLHDSICDWLQTWQQEAVLARQSGYFEHNKNGTLTGRHKF